MQQKWLQHKRFKNNEAQPRKPQLRRLPRECCGNESAGPQAFVAEDAAAKMPAVVKATAGSQIQLQLRSATECVIQRKITAQTVGAQKFDERAVAEKLQLKRVSQIRVQRNAFKHRQL